ncbi:hypothetical protein Glove_113g31 [Diversispora epigaea]|uniref:Uncharacterized protein n=1 Tax=Diversispora epigaea TaxID=1348612 RepID=A0A397J840_9GLOM|nr:hypothetical protein Glove_113g31 [Diversispora epigaea]
MNNEHGELTLNKISIATQEPEIEKTNLQHKPSPIVQPEINSEANSSSQTQAHCLLPNSHQQIEPELMCQLINDNRINEMIYTENNSKGLEILNICQFVKFLSEMDQFDHDKMKIFWMYSKTIQESTISGKEPFPGKMLKPFSKNIPFSTDKILDLMVAYYNDNKQIPKLQFQDLKII